MGHFIITILCFFLVSSVKANQSCAKNSDKIPDLSNINFPTVDIQKYIDMASPKVIHGKMSIKIERPTQKPMCNEDPLAVLDEGGGDKQERDNLIAESILEASGYDKNTFADLLVELSVNYEKTDVISEVFNKENEVLIPLDDVKNFGVKVAYLMTAIVEKDNKQYVDLGKLVDTKYEINSTELTLNINFPPDQMQDQNIAVERDIDMTDVFTKNSRGAFLNYEILLNNQKEGQTFSGLQDFTYFNEKGAFDCGVFVRYDLKKNMIVIN